MTRRGWLLFAAMSVIWGIPYLMIKVAVEGGISVPMVVFARTALGALMLLPLALRHGRPTWLRDHWKPLAAFAVLEILGPWALLAHAEQELSSSMTGLLIAAVPIIGVIVSRLLGDNERLGAVRWLGLGVGLLGVTVLALPGLGGDSPQAIIEVLVVAVCYAVAPLIMVRQLNDIPALPMTAVCLGLAAAVYAIPAALTWPTESPSAEVTASLVGLGLLCTALAFLLFFALIREVGTSRAVVFTYVNPAVAVVAGIVLLGETLTVSMAAAFGLILCGCLLATSGRRLGSTA
ncbi:MAG: DMT family transporter [Aeromicrobium sp.]|uniref:DMT family transporter n=1 Tax=Aeromicrobium sp. TaxID=1871063 RepID=UPI0039E4EC96